MESAKIGIIGGSGLYQMPELHDVEEITIETPLALRQMLLSWARLRTPGSRFCRGTDVDTFSRLRKFRSGLTFMR